MMDYDSNGVPVLSAEEIEQRVISFIEYFDKSCLEKPTFTPLREISEILFKRHGVNFIFNRELGSRGGRKILGRCILSPLRNQCIILIDPSLVSHDTRMRFTLAHELGHFVLHRNKKIILNALSSNEISDTDEELYWSVGIRKRLETAQDWTEYHANKFAAGLLMPSCTMRQAVEKAQRDMGITRRLGTIHLDEQRSSRRDFTKVANELAKIYRTSNLAVKIRLAELGIAENWDLKTRVFHISEVFANISSR